jgi:predicted phosphate transport protein (TIGR00153 family)
MKFQRQIVVTGSVAARKVPLLYIDCWAAMNLLPKTEDFFYLFEQHARILCRASKLLVSGLNDGYDGVCRIEQDISKIEEEGDRVIHDIFRHLRSTFITPFDPEDIQALASALDNVLDGIEDVTFRIVAYRLKPIPSALVLLAEMVSKSCSILAEALAALHKKKPLLNYCIEINRLENEADKLERNLIAELFRNEKDPIELIRKKEIYELLEATTDRCEDVADVIQNVSVKNS